MAGVSLVFAWTGPTQAPPGGNVDAPINVGSSGQIKSGALQVNGFRNLGATILGGNVGIGTADPGAKLHVAGGDIRIDAGRTIYSGGRMHIHGEEILYLLNKSGVVISNAWGGNGNLTVEGNVRANDVCTTGGKCLSAAGGGGTRECKNLSEG